MCDKCGKISLKDFLVVVSIIVALLTIQGFTYKKIDGRVDSKIDKHVIESVEQEKEILQRLSGLEKGQEIILEEIKKP